MKNFIRGTVLGLAVGGALFWYGGVPDYFPAVVAAMILIGVLLPLESQEKRLDQLLEMVTEIRDQLEDMEPPVVLPPSAMSMQAQPQQRGHTFIPTIQADTLANHPVPQKKQTVDRSLQDVAKKLSSMQGGGLVSGMKKE